jgi:hypothetical protein
VSTRDRFWRWRQDWAARLNPTRLHARLREGWRLYVRDQVSFFRLPGRPPLRLAPRRISSLLDRVPPIPPAAPHPPLLATGPVQVVSERQFVFDERNYYVYLPGTVFASFKQLFPNVTLYEATAPECFGSFGYAHGNYYHDMVELGFQAWWLAQRGLTIPVLYKGLPKGYQGDWLSCLESLGVSFLLVPSRLARLRVERFFVLPEPNGRVPIRPWNYEGEIFDQFSRYVDDLRRRLLPPDPAPAPNRVIYSTRRGRLARIPPNNQALEGLMTDLGVEVVDMGTLPWVEQVRLMNQTSMAVGLHGANLTNVMFMRPGCKVVELMPQKKQSDDAYKRLSHIRRLDYHRLDLPPGSGVDLEFVGKALSALL